MRRVALYMDLRSDYEHGIARGVIRHSKEHGLWRLFGHGWTLDEVTDFGEWDGDGVIAIIRNRKEARLLAKTGLPVVDVAGAVDHPPIYPVTNNDSRTGQMIGEHLLLCGLRHFAFCGVTDAHWSDERLSGFAAALKAQNLTPTLFTHPLPWWEKAGCPRALKQFAKALPRPIGIMAANDSIGVKMTGALQQLGVDVPNEAAVVGVDNEDVLCELSTPSLSSIPCDCERIGYEAASILDRLMRKETTPPPPLRIEPQSLTIRASSDMVACDDEMVHIAMRFIRQSQDLGINVSDVNRQVPLCRRSLEIRFRREVGHSIHHEIRRTRIERACHLLSSTQLPIAKVAASSGFSGIQRFYAVFSEAVGVSPAAYRNRFTHAG